MKTLKALTITSAAVLSIGLAAPAMAEMKAKGPITYYDLATNPHVKQELSSEQMQNLRDYFSYQDREPCQNYKNPPAGFVRDACNLYMMKEVKQEYAAKPVKARKVVLADYEVHFAFDSAKLGDTAHSMLDRIADEIKTHNPREVVVVGHTDTAGPSDYNVALSERRAQSVSDALTEMGIENRVLEKVAKGEQDLEVSTADGVPMLQNRRVEIRFMK